MALKTFNVQGGLSIGSVGDVFDANANLNLTANIPNVSLGNVSNLHISGGRAYIPVATATVFANGAIDTITLSNVGLGYDIAPTITITGANTSVANISASLAANGSISSFTYTDRGLGYANGTIGVTFSSPGTKYLKTDGLGNLAWYEVQATGGGGGGTPGGSNTQVQFNDSSILGGSNAFTFNKTTATTTFGNVISISGNTGGNIDEVTTANITSTANTDFNIKGAANANLTITASNNKASLSSNGLSGSTVVGYANANANLSVANAAFTTNSAVISVAANASNTTGNSATISVGSDSGITATSAFGNVTLGVTSSGNTNGAKANAALSNTAITLQTAANGANATGNSASLSVTTTGITGTAANGNVTIGTTVQGNANAAKGNVVITTANVTLQTAANGANTTGNSASLGVTTTGITGAASNGNITLSTTVQGNANDAQGNIILNNAAVTLQTAANAANTQGNSSSITLGTTSGITATSANGNITLAVTTASATNSAKANAKISNTTITLSAASNGANLQTNSTVVTIDDTDGANIKANSGAIGLYYTDGANAAGNLVISNNSIAFSTQSNTGNTNLALARLNLSASGESNLTASGNIVIKSDANLANTYSSAQILLNGNSNSVTIGANANSTLVVTDSNATFNSNVLVTGNLTVQGNTIYANTETFTVEDPIVEIGTGANGAILTTNDGKDRGIDMHTYGNGNTYQAAAQIAADSTTIDIADTTGITVGMFVTTLLGTQIAPGTTVTAVTPNVSIDISANTLATINNNQDLQIGTDTLRFMGWDNSAGEFGFGSNVTISNEVVTWGTYGNVRAANFRGNLVNGNSNIVVDANAAIRVGSNGIANVFTVNSSSSGTNIALGLANVVAGGLVEAVTSGSLTVTAVSANLASMPAGATGNGSMDFTNKTTSNIVVGTTINSGAGADSTTEFWAYIDGDSLDETAIITEYSQFSGIYESGIRILSNANIETKFSAYGSGQSPDVTLTANTPLTANTWTHFAVINDVSNSNSRMYIGGNLAATGANSQYNIPALSHWGVGVPNNGGTGFLGKLYGYRVSNSVRYTANFTPSATYGIDANTKVFLRFNEGSTTYESNVTAGNLTLSGNLTAQSGDIDFTGANTISLGSVGNVSILGGNSGTVLQTYGNGTIYWGNAVSTDFSVGGNFTVGGSPGAQQGVANITTTTTTANQTVVKFTSNYSTIELLINAVDANNGNAISTKLHIFRQGNTVDYTTYGSLQFVGTPGTIVVNLADANANTAIQVTPASTNTTTWTTTWTALRG